MTRLTPLIMTGLDPLVWLRIKASLLADKEMRMFMNRSYLNSAETWLCPRIAGFLFSSAWAIFPSIFLLVLPADRRNQNKTPG